MPALLDEQMKNELRDFIAQCYPCEWQRDLELQCLQHKSRCFAECRLLYGALLCANRYPHGDLRLAARSGRGSVVCVECSTEDGTHSRWFGIIRAFFKVSLPNPRSSDPPEVERVAVYVDYFARQRPGEQSPVKMAPHPDALTRRVVWLEDIVCQVMLLPTASRSHWDVVDGIQNE
jgi:hypothetical protein